MALRASRRIGMGFDIKTRNVLQNVPCVSVLVLCFVFALGVAVGAQIWGSHSQHSPLRGYDERKPTGSIQLLSDTPIRSTSHNDKHGRPITKQQFMEPFHVRNLAGYSVATLLPGQRVDFHRHDTMHEMFYILEGTGYFTIEGKEALVEPNTFIHIAPQELHGIFVPLENNGVSMKMLVVGVVVEDT